MGIDEGQPADDLTAELEAAYESEEVAEPLDTSIDETDDPIAAETETPEATEEPEEPEATPEAISAPDNWATADKDTFSALSEMGEQGKAAQEFLLTRHKAMEGDYTHKSQQNAEAMRDYEPIQAMFEPYKDQLAAQGLTPATQVQQWAQVAQNLASDPRGTIQWLANQNNVDMADIEAPPQVSPEISGLQAELNALKNSITQRETQDRESRLNRVTSQITDFSEMKTEAGELAHPYFADVMDEIVALATVERQAGREPDLSAMYDKAVWMNTSTRGKVISSQRQAEEAKRLEGARQKAAKAKQAGSSINGAPSGASPSNELDLREQLAQAFN